MSALNQMIEAILREELSVEPPGPDVDLIESGHLDSLGLITLVYEIEQRATVALPFESLEIDEFRTVNSIAALVDSRRSEEEE